MLLITPTFLLLILSFSMENPWVSSLTADTVFHRLTCHKGFKLANPFVLSKLEDAVVNCILKYPNPKSASTYRDCVNFCVATTIKMFTKSKSGFVFNKLNLKTALSEWFGGVDGPWILGGIADRFGYCMNKHSSILLYHYQNCKVDRNGRSEQAELWLCLQRQLPCETKPEDIKKQPNATKTTMSKFDRGSKPKDLDGNETMLE